MSQDSGTSTPADPGTDYDIFPTAHRCLHGEILYTMKQWSATNLGWQETEVEESTIIAKEPSTDSQPPFKGREIKSRFRGRDDADIVINCPTLRSTIANQIANWPQHFEIR